MRVIDTQNYAAVATLTINRSSKVTISLDGVRNGSITSASPLDSGEQSPRGPELTYHPLHADTVWPNHDVGQSRSSQSSETAGDERLLLIPSAQPLRCRPGSASSLLPQLLAALQARSSCLGYSLPRSLAKAPRGSNRVSTEPRWPRSGAFPTRVSYFGIALYPAFESIDNELRVLLSLLRGV